MYYRRVAFYVTNAMHERTKRLRQLMAQHRLSALDVSKMVGRSEQTVRTWRCKSENNSKVIPWQLLELLELKINKRGGQCV